MKKILLFCLSIILFSSCKESVVEKPDNLLDEDKMVDIIYDLSLLEAVKANNPSSLQTRKMDASTYVYKKYKIDSLQFAKSDRYYAADINKYSKIYDRVAKRIENNKTILDSAEAKEKEKREKKLLTKEAK